MDFTNIERQSAYEKKCADAIRTLKLFIKNAEDQLESTLPISTLHLIVDSINEEEE